jgi:carbon-monoxide dehydrogenase medium subunit
LTTSELSFTAPTTIEAAVADLADEGSMALGGGTSVAILLKNGIIDAEQLVYLGRIPDLSGITTRSDGTIRIGATTTLHDVSRSAVIRAELPVLAYAAEQIGNPRVRAVATVGGAVVHGDPRQDLPPVLLALEARVGVVGPRGGREIPVSEFFLGFMEVALDEDELVVEILVPPDPVRRAIYTRFTPGSDDDYPTVGVAVAVTLAPDGTAARARIALGGVASTAMLAHDAARRLEGQTPDTELIAAVAAAAAAELSPSDDQRGSADYKRAMVELWTRRTLVSCLSS